MLTKCPTKLLIIAKLCTLVKFALDTMATRQFDTNRGDCIQGDQGLTSVGVAVGFVNVNDS